MKIMYDSLLINSKNQLRYSTLCESLIFYGQTVLLIDYGSFPRLLREVGEQNLHELISSGELIVKVNETALGGGNVRDNIYMYSSFSSDRGSKISTITKGVTDVYGTDGDAHKIIESLSEVIGAHRHDGAFVDMLYEEALEVENLKASIQIVTGGKIKADEIRIGVGRTDEGFLIIESNVPNALIQEALFMITTGTGSLFDNTFHSTSLSIQSDTSNYVSFKLGALYQKFVKDQGEIILFQDKVLPHYADIGNTMESGAKSFDEFMTVWREARRFKEWLIEADDPDILAAYTSKISEKTWLDSIPTKSLRMLLFHGMGIGLDTVLTGGAASVAALGLSAIDGMVLDSLLKTWKPDQFVQGEFKNILNLKFE